MLCNYTGLFNSGETVAVALSGGSDSMALLHDLFSNRSLLKINVIAINVEHGIRGESSIKDSQFVKDYCNQRGIELLSYTVDCIKKAEEDKLSLEQAGRILRYECFYHAIDAKKCDKVATAHHLSDNTESVLLNIFRGSGLKGITGIDKNFNDKIIRPMLSVNKQAINDYIKQNNIPFVTDESNFCDEYTRNYLRLNIMPRIKDIFPDVEKSILRLTEIIKTDNDFIDMSAQSVLTITPSAIEIPIKIHRAVFSRAVIIALKKLGVTKDWEKVHLDSVFALSEKETGSKINLPYGVIAIKEYDNIALYKEDFLSKTEFPFFIGKKSFINNEIEIKQLHNKSVNLKDGFYADAKKIPVNAIIRTKADGDVFTKFGGGSKKLNDYLTNKKIPLKERITLPVLASGNDILVIFGVAISNKIKVDSTTTEIIEFTLG